MTEPDPENLRELQGEVNALIYSHWKVFLVQSAVIMLLGVVAVAVPHIVTIAVEVFIGWLLLVAGLFRTIFVFKARQAPGFWWSLVAALVTFALGVLLVARPPEGVLTLTMVLIAIFAVEGIIAIFYALQVRQHARNWIWTLFSGLANLLLAYLIWKGWPATADWAIGLLLGINMFMLGLSLATMALSARAAGPR